MINGKRERKKSFTHMKIVIWKWKSPFLLCVCVCCDNGSTISFISKIYHHEQLRIFSNILASYEKYSEKLKKRMKNENNKSEKEFKLHLEFFLSPETLVDDIQTFSCLHPVCFCQRCDNFSSFLAVWSYFSTPNGKILLMRETIINFHFQIAQNPLKSHHNFFAHTLLMSTSKSARDNSIKVVMQS